MDEGVQSRFGPYRLDLAEQRLWRGEQPVPVTRQSLAVLRTLLGRPGRLVTKTELFETVWRRTAVSDAALSRCIRELRVALGDDAANPSYIETVHGQGFRFIAKLARGGANPRPMPLLVGREAELGQLSNALRAAREGDRQLVFITGEPGIGKTSLIEAFLAGLVDDDVAVAQGRCIEQYGTGEAYLPIREALERLARHFGATRMHAVLAQYAPAWLAQLSWLAQSSDAALIKRAMGEATPQRMLREIVQALETLAADRPIILWLEDLHWSDYSSLDFVSFLAGRRDRARLLVLATYRPADVIARDTPLRALKQQLQLHGQCSELALEPLGIAAVERYVTARLVSAPTQAVREFAQFLHHRTDGNPLFMTNVADDLLRRGALAETDGEWQVTMPIAQLGAGIPENLLLLIEQQFDRLTDDERHLLEVAAVAGTDFSAASLAAGLQTEIPEVEARCANLARRDRFLRAKESIAWPDGTVAAGFGFRHALYRQALYERVPAGQRVELHRRLGAREELAYGTQAAAIAGELAMHFEVARDFARAVRYLGQAGKDALARHAYLEGVDLLRHALRLVDMLPAPHRMRQEFDLLLPLGAALMAAKGYAADDVKTTYARALELCRAIGTPAELIRVLRGLWNVSLIRSDMPTAQALANELLGHANASSDVVMSFDAYAKLGQTAVQRGEFATARVHLERALSLFQAASQQSRLHEAPRVAAYLAWALWYLGFPDQALARGHEALALARRLANPHSHAFALGFVAWVHQLRGESAPSLALAEEQAMLSREHGLHYWLAWSGYLKGLVATQRGDHARGLAQMRDSLTAYRALGAEAGVPFFLCHLAETFWRTGRGAEGLPLLDEAAALTERDGNRIYEADLYRLKGKLLLDDVADSAKTREAAGWFVRAIATAQSQQARSLLLRATRDQAELSHHLGRTAEAAAMLGDVLAGFTEGHDTIDLRGARMLLREYEARAAR